MRSYVIRPISLVAPFRLSSFLADEAKDSQRVRVVQPTLGIMTRPILSYKTPQTHVDGQIREPRSLEVDSDPPLGNLRF